MEGACSPSQRLLSWGQQSPPAGSSSGGGSASPPPPCPMLTCSWTWPALEQQERQTLPQLGAALCRGALRPGHCPLSPSGFLFQKLAPPISQLTELWDCGPCESLKTFVYFLQYNSRILKTYLSLIFLSEKQRCLPGNQISLWQWKKLFQKHFENPVLFYFMLLSQLRINL